MYGVMTDGGSFSFFLQKDCFEVYALVPGLLREEVLLLDFRDCVFMFLV